MSATAFIQDNIRRAIALLTATPEEGLDLQSFKNTCGSTHCAIGWLATDKHFQDLGIELVYGKRRERITLSHYVRNSKNPDEDGFEFLNPIFGPDAFDRLFMEYDDGDDDENILEYWPKLTHKALALARLELQLERMSK
ncbi:hypothetical protein LP414_27590 [Polaromonas sp. P1(28)-13]|nr:hypothetical protein LP414_27590 [Polaromonas sp. P1(28)-13]